MRQARLTIEARRDVDDIIDHSIEAFGVPAARRYGRLISAAIQDVASNTARLGVRRVEEGADEPLLYPIRYSRRAGPSSERIGRPRHVLIFRLRGEVVEVVRVLHDTMDLVRHLDLEG